MRANCSAHPRYTRGCANCSAANARYGRLRRAAVADGSWEPMLAGEALERVREHVVSLLALPGVTAPLLASIAGTTHHTVYRIVKRRGTALGPEIGRALLEVTPAMCRARRRMPGDLVNSIGVQRALQALAADGWDAVALSGLIGMEPKRLGHLRRGVYPTVRQATHDRVLDVYLKIQSQADPTGPSRRAAIRARALGYLPPECWLEDEICDPAAEPLPPPPDTDDHVAVTRLIEDALQAPAPGKAAGYGRSVKREIARHASRRLGWSYERIAELLGFKSANSVEYLLIGRKDRPHTRGGTA